MTKIVQVLLQTILFIWNPTGDTQIVTVVNAQGPQSFYVQPYAVEQVLLPAGIVKVTGDAESWIVANGAVVNGMTPRSQWRFPVMPHLGISIANPDLEGQRLTLRWGTYSRTVTLKSGEQISQWLEQWLQLGDKHPDLAGTLIIEAEKPIVVFAAVCRDACVGLPSR